MLIFADGRERISQDAECDRESVRGAFDGNKHTPDICEDGSSRLSCSAACAYPARHSPFRIFVDHKQEVVNMYL